MTNASGNISYLRVQKGNHNSLLLPPATGIKVSMSEISPLPKCTKERKRKRAPQKSQILSFSPCKGTSKEKRENLEEKAKKTERLKRRKISAGGSLKIDAEIP
jgi:hypothetical protein